MPASSAAPPVAPIDHVYGTLGLVHATSTQRYAELAGMRGELEGRGSFTMFAPSDDAWAELDRVSSPAAPQQRSRAQDLQFSPSLQAKRASLESNVNMELHNALHFHMVNRRFLTRDLKNDISVSSMYNKLGLYINHYSNGVSLPKTQINVQKKIIPLSKLVPCND